MYFVPVGLFIARWDSTFVSVAGLDAQARELSWLGFLIHNVLPMTLGNMIGGSVLVGVVYWFVYLRRIGQNADRVASTR